MKNYIKTVVLVILITITLPSTSIAMSTDRATASYTEKTDAADAQRSINRLEEIKLMDTKNLSRKEKRVLRHEVKTIERKLQTNGGGIYISVGALIIIILLLIIIF